LAYLIPIFSIGFSPQPTVLDLRQDVTLRLPETIEAGAPLILQFSEPENLLIDGKKGTLLPSGQVLLAPSDLAFGYSSMVYYRRYENRKLLWWSRPIKIQVMRKSAFRLPASIPSSQWEDYHKELLTKLSKRVRENLRSPCFSKPLNSIVTSRFGEPRLLPNGKFYRHNGVDQRAWIGVKVKSVSDGTIIYADQTDVTGRMIIIDHGSGISSRYMHLSELRVNVGDQVVKGQVIGLSGNSGRSLAPHLHWELSWKGSSLDPLNFLQKMAPICGRG